MCLSDQNAADSGACDESKSLLRTKSVHSDRGRGRASKLFSATAASTLKVRSRSCDAPLSSTTKKSVQLTVPISPKLRVAKRGTSKAPPLSTEQMEENQIKESMEMEKARLRKAKMAFERFKLRSKQNNRPTAIRSTKQLTIPRTPNSQLTKKLGTKKCSIVGSQAENEGEKEKGKLSQPTKSTSPRGLTVVQPFHLATEERIPVDKSKKDVTLTAGEVQSKFINDPRSHEVPLNACKGLTDARAPVLQTEKRAHNGAHTLPMSTEEREKLLWEEIRKHAFKAKPVDPEVLAPPKPSPRGETKPLTQPVEFELKTSARANERKHVPAQEEKFTFKARPVPDFTAHPSSPNKHASTFKPTVALSPKLGGERRASSAPSHRQRPHHSVVEKEKMEKERAARSSVSHRHITEPKAFHFVSDARGSAYRQSLAERLNAEREAEAAARVVKAKPVPTEILNKPFHVKPSEKELTNFSEFHLRTDDRHEVSEQKFQAELAAEEERLHKEFKAIPVPKTTYKPGFELEFDDQHLVVPINVHLESEARASKRKEFDEKVAAHKLEEEKKKQAELQRSMDKENEDIKQLRRMTVDKGGLMFVAKPVEKDDHYPVKPAKAIPLTQPKSPHLRTKERAATKAPHVVEESSLVNIDAF